MLPFSFRHRFSLFFLFSAIFLIFLHFFKHEQNSWFQIMEFIESTHAKLIRALKGGPTFMIFPQIFFVRLIVLHFVVCMRLFWICYLANFVSHKGVLACYPCMLFLTYFRELCGHVCYWWLDPYMMWFLGVQIHAWFA